MTILILFVATAVIFFVLDAIMLTFVMRPLFESHISSMLLENVRYGPAAMFYLGYVAGLLWLVAVPALKAGNPMQALIGGMVIGAMAYGTYEFSNYATLKDWHPSMVAVDVIWGTVLTGVSAWAGVLIARTMTT